MTTITLQRRELRPFERVEGRVAWNLDKPPRDLELRLFWFTRGEAAGESTTIGTLPLGDESRGERAFSFELPDQPWSIKGQVVEVAWALELVAGKTGGLALEEFVVGPERRVIELPEVADSKYEHRLVKWAKRRRTRGG